MSVRVAIIGVGNCASCLVQGVHHYRDDARARPDGLMSPLVGRYTVDDVEFSAAFDVNATKVGSDLSDAIRAAPNNAAHYAEVPYLDVTVMAGKALDGVGEKAGARIAVVEGSSGIADHLRATETDVVVNFLPVGSETATELYAAAAIDAGCGFVNAIPVFLASKTPWRKAFADAGLPLIGDDVKSQVGATIVHRQLTELFAARGVRLERTYQLNVGGNMDFLNMLEEERLASKRESKSRAVTDVANGGEGLRPENVHIGPSDYVPWLGDRKLAFIRLEGTAFAGAPLSIEVRMDVHDSPNSAGVVIDAVRYAKSAMDSGDGGVLEAASAWLMKSPPVSMTDDQARRKVAGFIAGVEEAAGKGGG